MECAPRLKRFGLCLLLVGFGLTLSSAAHSAKSFDDFLSQDLRVKKEPQEITILRDQLVKDLETGQNYRKMLLKRPQGNPFRLHMTWIGESKESIDQKVPLLIVFSGVGVGAETVELLGESGPAIVASIDYPQLFTVSLDINIVREHVHNSSSAIWWLANQPWVDPDKISMMGVSFGGMSLPIVARTLDWQGLALDKVILAYSGGDLTGMAVDELSSSLNLKIGKKEKSILRMLLSSQLRHWDPNSHLPYLQGPDFLVVNGTDDEVFSKESIESFTNAVPNPKTIIQISGSHINSDKAGIIDELKKVISEWLFSDEEA